MNKNILAGLSALFVTFTLKASLGVGDWRVYNTYDFNVNKVIDTPAEVYFLNDGNLFSYDKKSEVMHGFNTLNGLSDNRIVSMYKHPERNQLMLFYESGNIDVVLANGDVVNMSDIKDAQRISDKTLNDVAFLGNKAYVATGFGIVEFNLDNFSVTESGIFNIPVTSVTVAGDHLLIVSGDTLYSSPVGGRHNTFSAFTPLGQLSSVSMEWIGGTLLLSTDGQNSHLTDIDFDNGTISVTPLNIKSLTPVQRFGEGFQLSTADAVYVADNTGKITKIAMPDAVRCKNSVNAIRYSSLKGEDDIWYMTEEGIGNFSVSGGNLTIKMQPARPMALSVNSGVSLMHVGESSKKIYVGNKAESRVVSVSDNLKRMAVNVIDDGFVSDITPLSSEVTYNNPSYKNTLRAGYSLVEDPEEEGVVYVGTYWEGIYKFRDGKQTGKYDWLNYPLQRDWTVLVPALAFDVDNNLWTYSANASSSVIAVLPASKRGFDNVTADDWTVISARGFGTNDTRDAIIMPLRHSSNKGLVVISEGYATNNLMVYDTAGTIESTGDDSHQFANVFYDQDGKSFGPVLISAMCEDLNGNVWIGTKDGVIVMHSPRSFLNGTNSVERVKVPRNDGTSYADYLLESQVVTGIAVDNSNRKWISTAASGVYLVSADGKEIIENFTEDNSPLNSNLVYSVACDPLGNSVFFGTPHGLVEYGGDATPVAPDFSDIYAYPNPVRPDYTGWITVAGLMDGTLVKITDAAGNLFYQTKSTGGSVTWDGCNSSGERVKTGVYYVFASSSEGESTSGAVTKILVVN